MKQSCFCSSFLKVKSNLIAVISQYFTSQKTAVTRRGVIGPNVVHHAVEEYRNDHALVTVHQRSEVA